jgi:hypothetical protein
VNGFHVADVQAMARATRSLEQIDAVRCRRSVASRYDAAIVAEGYEDVYYRALSARRPAHYPVSLDTASRRPGPR